MAAIVTFDGLRMAFLLGLMVTIDLNGGVSMQRTCMNFLNNWLQNDNRRPLVIRGARQVGKTWVVRELARSNNRKLIELSFAKNIEYKSLFLPTIRSGLFCKSVR